MSIQRRPRLRLAREDALVERCSFPECQAAAHSRGMCSTHYGRWLKTEHHKGKLMDGRPSVPVTKYHGVYIIGCDETEPVKVGRAANIIKRRYDMQVGCPWKLRIYGALFLHPYATIWLETETHRTLTDMGFHLHGEWFDAPKEQAQPLLEKVCRVHGIPFLLPYAALSAAQDDPAIVDARAHNDFVRTVSQIMLEMRDTLDRFVDLEYQNG